MNWIHVNTTLPTSPKILMLAEKLKCKRREAFGLAVEFFCWLDANFSNGHTKLSAKQIDQLFDKKRFAEAMCEIGWGSIDENGCFIVQDFDSYNGKTAKMRMEDARRQGKYREKNNTKTVTKNQDSSEKCHNKIVTKSLPKEEKSIYIDNVSSNESTLSDPQKQTKAPQPESPDAVLTYISSLPSCGLSGEELVTCAATFFDRSEAVGWTINGQPIRDWRAAARAYLAKWQGNNASQYAASNSNRPKITYRSQTKQNYDLR